MGRSARNTVGTKRIFDPNDQTSPVCYCRKCMSDKPPSLFLNAVDPFLDASGKLSVCNTCIDKMYEDFYLTEKTTYKTIYALCKILNIKYDGKVVDMTLKALETMMVKGRPYPLFSGYVAKLKSLGAHSLHITDFTFTESDITTCEPDEQLFEEEENEDIIRIRRFWGYSFDAEDLQNLESKYIEWSSSHKIETQSERILLKFICLKELEIEKAITQGKNTSSIIKEFQDLLKSAALTPAQATASSSGKGTETWGVFIKMIEETEPAEFYKEKDLFDDVSGIKKYIENYIVRPLKNFVLGSKEFEIREDDYEEEDTFFEPIQLEEIEENAEGNSELSL
jgi:hypothetical protein